MTAYVESLSGTRSAPVLATSALPPGASCFLVVAQVPNPFGEPLLQHWYGVPFSAGGVCLPLRTLESLIADLRLADPDLANPGSISDATVDMLRSLRKRAVDRAIDAMLHLRHEFAEKEDARNSARERALSARLSETSRQMELRLGDIRDLGIRRMKAVRLEQERRDREKELADFVHWAKTNRHPEAFVHAVIVAVFVNAPVESVEVRHV